LERDRDNAVAVKRLEATEPDLPIDAVANGVVPTPLVIN
jgi:hypothetical protein